MEECGRKNTNELKQRKKEKKGERKKENEKCLK